MTKVNKLDDNTNAAVEHSQWTNVIAGSVAAITYCRAAQRDERNGFGLTAAMEWHRAAELTASLPAVANFCWKQWERIMHLPRQFAQPISAPSQVAVNASSTPPSAGSLSPAEFVTAA